MADPTRIPGELRERQQWLCWREQERDGKATKVPIDPKTGDFGSSTDDRTWTDFEMALEYAESGEADGIGFVFTNADSTVGVDLDDCRDPDTGRPDSEAKAIVTRLDSYTEVSPSGTGYHVLLSGALPEGRNRRGSVEMYDRARFFTVTGEHVPGTPSSICDRQDELEGIHAEYVEPPDEEGSGAANPSRSSDSAVTGVPDEELLDRATNAANGAKFDRLWNGSTAGYDSSSEADMALCCLLAFWTGGDPARVDRLFRRSGLSRDKWDEVHFSDGSTYGEKTIERAIANTSESYEPPSTRQSQEAPTRSKAIDQNDGGDPDRQTAYLEQKNRVLSERVDQLETELDRKSKRIASLERAIEQVAGHESRTDTRTLDSQRPIPRTTGEQPLSVIDRIKRLFRG